MVIRLIKYFHKNPIIKLKINQWYIINISNLKIFILKFRFLCVSITLPHG